MDVQQLNQVEIDLKTKLTEVESLLDNLRKFCCSDASDNETHRNLLAKILIETTLKLQALAHNADDQNMYLYSRTVRNTKVVIMNQDV